jgi:c-di-GMP-binding flagellar brake protein YcgR
VHEVGPGATVSIVDLLLMPMANALSVDSGRRSYHRVSFEQPVSFPLRRMGWTDTEWFTAEMLDLSAGGLGARVSRSVAVGERFRIELPAREACSKMEAEVVHCRPVGRRGGDWQVGFRLLGVTERVRSLLQREVLRQERLELVKRRKRVELRSTGTESRRAFVGARG